MIINTFGEERCAANSDWDAHHYGKRNDNGGEERCDAHSECDCLNKTDLAGVHTHDEEHAQTDAVDENFEAELANENHPDDMLDPDVMVKWTMWMSQMICLERHLRMPLRIMTLIQIMTQATRMSTDQMARML